MGWIFSNGKALPTYSPRGGYPLRNVRRLPFRPRLPYNWMDPMVLWPTEVTYPLMFQHKRLFVARICSPSHSRWWGLNRIGPWQSFSSLHSLPQSALILYINGNTSPTLVNKWKLLLSWADGSHTSPIPRAEVTLTPCSEVTLPTPRAL